MKKKLKTLLTTFMGRQKDCDPIIEDNHVSSGHTSTSSHSKEKCETDQIPLNRTYSDGQAMSDCREKQLESSEEIPESITFLDMYGVSNFKELNVLERWKKNRTYESMKVLIGQKAGSRNCFLDIHEGSHGPHGLVVGTTGSGKSEILQTYILSLTLNFSPLDVGLFIIDPKGVITNPFSNLPHTLGEISTLSVNQVRRAKILIESEILKRQRVLAKNGLNNITSYTKLFKQNQASEPMPHLLIIIDEFDEFIREEPGLCNEIISIVQLGRALGIHLILATQKSSSGVHDFMQFRLCLRVDDRQDSENILHKPDATYLTQTGRGYLQVAKNEICELFQSGYSGAPHNVDGTKIDQKKVNQKEEISQLDALITYLQGVAKENNLCYPYSIKMPVLPIKFYLDNIPAYCQNSYSNGSYPEENEYSLKTWIGLVDDLANQRQYPLEIDFEKGHLMVAGNVTSGKSSFLQTLAYSMITRYSPERLNIYAIDFSDSMLCCFEKDAHFGSVVEEGEDDRLNKLFRMISDVLADRKQLIKGGSFAQYICANGPEMPAIIIMIDGYANFREKTENRFESNLLELAQSAESYGIYLVITCSGFGSPDIQMKIADNMRQRICLEMDDKFEYAGILNAFRFDILPEKNIKGRGLANINGNICEYQTALVCDTESDYVRREWIEKRCVEMSRHWSGKLALEIPSISEKTIC